MVLYKRKPVQFIAQPKIEDEEKDIWLIPETDEIFTSYESYLQRMDWYKARKFICEISGHSGLSFFDALKSERAGAREVEGSFPEALKAPVLRKVQFSVVSRIDSLVDRVYDEFKNDFFPGEHVSVLLPDSERINGSERVNGVVREKASFSEIRNEETGEIVREAFARYFVRLTDRPEQETLVDDSKVSRDRKVFTKQMLRSFIKNTVTREAWNGAPWLVKQRVAEQYKIPTDVPLHLRQSYKIAEKKERRKVEQQEGRKNPSLSAEQIAELKQNQWNGYPNGQLGSPLQPAPNGWAQSPYPHHQNGYPIPPGHPYHPHMNGHPTPPHSHIAIKPPSRPEPPPPVVQQMKFPAEDMECPPLDTKTRRPNLNFMVQSQKDVKEEDVKIVPGLKEETVGLLLETWNTLNVYCQVLLIDSFVFDDFLDAMQFTEPEVTCELFEEIHCAVLKKLVNPENEQNGAIQIALPDLPDPEDSSDEEENEESRITTPTPEPDVPARRTRSSLNKMALAEQERPKSPTPEETIPHRAAEMFGDDYSWIQRLRKRDFKNGGWQLVMVGLLHQLSGRERLSQACERILVHLAPLDADPTIETVEMQYSTLDINLRAEALQIICQLFLETQTVKNFLEDMAKTMTEFRKAKIEHQRARKESIAALKKLYEERRQLAPAEKSPSPVAELEELEDADKMVDIDNSEIVDTEDDQPPTRSLRRGIDRALERKRKREAEEQRREKAKEERATKGSKEYQKVLKNIDKEHDKVLEHQKAIETIDGDLREADAYRTRCLGKDRFCNRYWWFERNAMPYAGLPDSSTADVNYANGRLWVQGPDEMERLGFIDVDDAAKGNYSLNFGMTPRGRKDLEEGETHLEAATQWGFYDSADDVDALIDWLDSRGIREGKLKKELQMQKDLITEYMRNRRKHVYPGEAKDEEESKSDEEDSDEGPRRMQSTRMATRGKVYVSDDLLATHRCLRWKNSSALSTLGHRHVDPPPPAAPRNKKGIVAKNVSFPDVKSTSLEPMRTRKKERDAENVTQLNRQGKPVTRQGTRYNF